MNFELKTALLKDGIETKTFSFPLFRVPCEFITEARVSFVYHSIRKRKK